MKIEKITVLGGGVLGSQIAFQAAHAGLPVVVHDLDDAAVEAAGRRLDALVPVYATQAPGGDQKSAAAARGRILLTTSLQTAADADLVIEAVPEVLTIKQEIFAQLNQLAAPSVIFATNSSTLLPSDMVDATGRPERFLALHFANQIWRLNTAEIMGTPETAPEVLAAVVQFAERIGMVPIELHKEKAGYVLNSLLVPLLNAGMSLVAGGFADAEAVDTTWRIGTGAPLGPLQILDVIGLNTPYNILANSDTAEARQLAGWLKANYLDKGYLGVETGRGFHTYA